MNNAVCRLGDLGYIEPGSHAHKYESIGCSRVADILGCGYRTPNELWQQMTHRAPDEGHKRIFDRGHAMEAHGAQMIQKDHGRVLVAEQVQYRDPARPWLIYHADGMFPTWTPLNEGGVERGGPGIWEFKAPGTEMADKMRRDGMSQSYICQGQAGMYVASVALQRAVNWATYGFIDYNAWELVAFDMAALPRFQRDALQLIDRFWDCVVRDTPPTDINPNEVPQIPVISGEQVTITDGDLPILAERLREIQPALKEMKDDEAMLKEQMKAILEPYASAVVPGVMKFSYGYSKPGETIDGAGLLTYCEHLCALLHGAIEPAPAFRRSDWVTPKAPTRTFRPTPVKG
jgi:hypothetical protein